MARESQQPVWERAAGQADFTLALPNGLPMFFRRIAPVCFRMGSRGFDSSEEPAHWVTLPHEYYLGTFPVTQEQYETVAARAGLPPRPSHFPGARRPVEKVSWNDATAFCRWLQAGAQLPPGIGQVRLPCEAEWEHACRGGSDAEYYTGDGEEALAQVGWYEGNSGNATHPVDELAEDHPFGLFGMHGNVWEWCDDVYDPHAYRKRIDPWEAYSWSFEEAGREAWDGNVTEANAFRVLRGGSWGGSARDCRSAFRGRVGPVARSGGIGFRVCLVPGPASGRGAPSHEDASRAPGGAGRGTRPEPDGASAAGPDLARASLPRRTL